ncbi:hypothetical protein PAECIP111893_01343 [Paenibacillus plantiphilus]|uniref:Sporulation protein n=1 Tax=Paenibacillus plantiphilus TaxID=2905650 RepID=A0ABN8G8N0_9BACL|nr:hypothetical protein [Paenibacillus plantiphilus]CAH1199394.1 hypothetical protein PAECIP111893_01343 [Paenibacillus plantiphilus]
MAGSNRKLTQAGMKWISVALMLGLLLMLSACGNNNGGNNDNNDNNGNTSMKTRSYGNDGYLGRSNSNPHLPNRNGSYLNYGEDGDFAEKKLKEIGGIAKMNITFQGTNLYATLRPEAGVDEAQLRHKALSVLRSNMPRYIVHVNTSKQ